MLEVGSEVEPPDAGRREPAADCSIAGVLQLVGAETSAQMLTTLGRAPMRTRQLTDRVESCSARSVYRHADKMEACGVIRREREPGVPSKVVLSLTEPAGRELYRLLRAFADTAKPASGGVEGPAFQWSTVGLLGELWKLGMVEELSYEPRSLAQFARGRHDLTFHQVSRRLSTFIAAGLVADAPSPGIAKLYGLTDFGRRCLVLIAGIGRWRRHVISSGIPGLTVAELATVLRATMPLTNLPEHVGKSLELGVTLIDGGGSRETQALQGAVDVDGTLRYTDNVSESPEGSTSGTINTWLAALLDGNRGRMRVRGEQALVDAFLTQLYDALWGNLMLSGTGVSGG